MIVHAKATPYLNTKATASLEWLENHFLAQRSKIENWLEKQWQLTLPPIYGSVDLRNAGFKLAPIDMNLFPAGFNNLNPNFLSCASEAARKMIQRIKSNAEKILIIPESHTRNLFYWENILTLKKILLAAGFEIRLASLDPELKTKQEIAVHQQKIILEPLLRRDDELYVTDGALFLPDIILLNNDLSEGIPNVLQDLKQPIMPPAELGWSVRLKSAHFQNYANVVAEFSQHIDIDPWLIAPLFKHCGKIDFMQQNGMECLIEHAEYLFREIQKKYDEYHIPYQPFLIVKADAGTYGMAVMTVRSLDELRTLNRKQRTRMSKTKGGQPVTQVIIQEGVYTFETIGEERHVAEPVVYLWGSHVVGGFYRIHNERGIDENLNSPGMHFEPMAFLKPCNEPCASEKNSVESRTYQNRLYVYGLIAQLSMLAAAREMKDLLK